MTAQDKILYVANKLGLTSLQNMQASTGAVYDVDTERSGQIFSSATRHVNPQITNINDNQFEVNEALLIETVGFYGVGTSQAGFSLINLQTIYGSEFVIVYDIIIGNKRVQKNTPVFGSGSPYTFANTGILHADGGNFPEEDNPVVFTPRHQVYSEAVGILIPPQVQFYVEYRLFNVVTGAQIPINNNADIACYLYGTKVLLNFNTSI
jgi:hypothetical protein